MKASVFLDDFNCKIYANVKQIDNDDNDREKFERERERGREVRERERERERKRERERVDIRNNRSLCTLVHFQCENFIN